MTHKAKPKQGMRSPKPTSYWQQLAIMLIMNGALLGACFIVAMLILYFSGEL